VATALALVVPAFGETPVVREVAPRRPGPGEAQVRLRAAGVNPADIAIAAGRFYLPLPEPPFVAGCEAVGEIVSSDRHPEGARVWCLQPAGCFSEVFPCPEDGIVPVPDAVDDDVAVAMGVAGLAGWMPVRDRGQLGAGETVLVLGASGVAGQVAMQAARVGGAGRVVGAVRSHSSASRARAAGADATVVLGGADDATAIRDATGGGADLVVDTLWGDPIVAALASLRPGGRIVQVGNGASPTVAFPAGPLRGGRLDIRGFSVFSESPEERARAYVALAGAAARGEIAVPTERIPLADGPSAWARQMAGSGGVKLVLVP
jgi:NADPH2:quinone reductase